MLALINFLIPFLIAVESNGNVYAEGDGGAAHGHLQIHIGVIEDVNKFYKTKYTCSDRKDYKKSIQICSLYLQYWGRHYEKQTGKKVTLEVLARIWNGGPSGWKKVRKLTVKKN
jgi:hypothetical protein